jgi:hypothetical protein
VVLKFSQEEEENRDISIEKNLIQAIYLLPLHRLDDCIN